MTDSYNETVEGPQEMKPIGPLPGSVGRGGSGGLRGDLSGRVSKLEAHIDHMFAGIGDVQRKLEVLNQLPTKRDLDTWQWQWMAIGLAVVALTVGGVVGGLALINRTVDHTPAPAAAVQPVIVQVPAYPQPQSVPPPPR